MPHLFINYTFPFGGTGGGGGSGTKISSEEKYCSCTWSSGILSQDIIVAFSNIYAAAKSIFFISTVIFDF